jgi:hypothetical protein
VEKEEKFYNCYRLRLKSFALMVAWRKADDHPLALAAAGLVGGDVLVTRVCWGKW